MKKLIYILIFSTFLFSEKIQIEEFYSADYKSEFYYDAVLSCDEVLEKKAKIGGKIANMRPQNFYLHNDIVSAIFQTYGNIEYQNLENRLENLKSLEKEKCKNWLKE